MDVFERAKNICFNPKNTWQQIVLEPTTVRELFVTYACLLALIPSLANFIGLSFVGSTSMGMRYRVPFFSGLVYAVASYAFSLLSIYVLALIIDACPEVRFGEKPPERSESFRVFRHPFVGRKYSPHTTGALCHLHTLSRFTDSTSSTWACRYSWVPPGKADPLLRGSGVGYHHCHSVHRGCWLPFFSPR